MSPLERALTILSVALISLVGYILSLLITLQIAVRDDLSEMKSDINLHTHQIVELEQDVEKHSRQHNKPEEN